MDRPAKNSYELMYRLLAAWVNGVSPDGMTASEIDFDGLWQAADRHFLSAAVCIVLKKSGLLAGCPPSIARRFLAAEGMSIRKTLLMDAEREKLLAILEENGIWYMPLKGVVLNGLYPRYGTRQFGDNDILFDAARWREVRELMKGQGYEAKSVGKGSHDTYIKPPVYYFEMHRRLFTAGETMFSAAPAYYQNVKERLVKDAANHFGYHFSDEDCYIYFLAHAYKHCRYGGAGVRTLLDIWLYRRKKSGLHKDYIAGELEKLGISRFERCCGSLSEKLFSWPPQTEALTSEEREMLAWMETSGVYGTVEHHVRNDLSTLQRSGGNGQAKRAYLFRRLFPELAWYQASAPFCYRHRWAIPFFWVYRLFRGIFTRGKRIFRELSVLWRDYEDPPES